jgi:hypothetical protein
MKQSQCDKIPIIYLEWIDAYGNSRWFSKTEFLQFMNDECWMKEVGFLIKETDKYLIFAQRFSGYKLEQNDQQYGSIHKIPKTWIRKKRILGYINNQNKICFGKKKAGKA